MQLLKVTGQTEVESGHLALLELQKHSQVYSSLTERCCFYLKIFLADCSESNTLFFPCMSLHGINIITYLLGMLVCLNSRSDDQTSFKHALAS